MKLALGFIVMVLGAVSMTLAMGRKKQFPPSEPPQYSSWVVYWDTTNGQRALMKAGHALEEISVFAYQFNANARLIPATFGVPDLQDWIKRNIPAPRPRLLMTVVNDVAEGSAMRLKDAACVHRVLSAPDKRAAHIQQLLALAEGLDGIDIDYERLDLADREAFSLFIKELGEALHARGQWLSVVVQPRTEDTDPKDRSGAGVIDWPAILPQVDRIKIMAYLFHHASSDPGSIAPLPAVSRLAEFALETIPVDKLCIVLHLGGFDWPQDGLGRQIEYPQAALLAAIHNQTIALDKNSASGHFQYEDRDVSHEVWIEVAAGLKSKIQVLQELGVEHIGLWRLGAGDPDLWEQLWAP